MTFSHPEVMTMRTTKASSSRSSISTSSTSISGDLRSKSTSKMIIPGSKALKDVSDRRLLSNLRRLSEKEHETVLSILVHLIEIDRRRLYLEMGYSSLFKLCVKEFKYSESVAGRWIAVARCIKRFPRAYRALASGKVNMSNLGRIASIMNESNEKELLRSIIGATGREVEHLVSRHSPRSVIRDSIKPVYVRTEIMVAGAGSAGDSKNQTSKSLDRRAGVTPTGGSGKSPNSSGSEDMFSGSGPAAATESGSKAAAMMVLEERFVLKFGASQEFLDKIARLRSLLSSKYHRIPEFEELFSIVMDEYLERHSPEGRIRRKQKRERRKASLEKGNGSGKTAKTSKKPGTDKKEISRYIPRKVRDEVYARDKGRCSYVSPGGRRCAATWDLQVDHIVPFGRGGDNSPSNLRLLCAKHNRLEAERVYGKEKMENHTKKHGEQYVKNHGGRYVKEPADPYVREHKGLYEWAQYRSTKDRLSPDDSIDTLNSVPDYLYQHTFLPPAVEFSVKDLLPGPEIQRSPCNGYNDLTSHHLSLEVGVAIILSGPVVAVCTDRFVRCEFLKPLLVIGMQTTLVVIDKDGSSDMHRIDKAEPLRYPALSETFIDMRSDVQHRPSSRYVKPQFLAVTFHQVVLSILQPVQYISFVATTRLSEKVGIMTMSYSSTSSMSAALAPSALVSRRI